MSEWNETIRYFFIISVIVLIIGIITNATVQLYESSILINNQVNENTQNEVKIDFIKYNNQFILGGEAVSFVYKNCMTKKIGIIIDNGISEKYYILGLREDSNGYNFDDEKKVENIGLLTAEKKREYYIKSSDIYKANLLKNKYDVIIGIYFQKLE